MNFKAVLDSLDDAARAIERERCAKIAETIEIPCNGHPQIDAPTISDARRVIAAAIRNPSPSDSKEKA